MELLSLYPGIADAIWGGQRLINEFGFKTQKSNISEAWLLSCHEKGLSTVIGGKYDGKTLAEVIETEGKQILGTKNKDKEYFPILIKLIDANDKLSIQVHPGDEYARIHENENGKTEAWYIIDAQPGATLFYGVKEDLAPEQFSDAIKNDTVLDVLNSVEVKAGDVVFIPSGMIHAIGKGIFLAEVQQSSATTYRIYDYNRPDPNNGNKPRDLHVKQACDVADLNAVKADFAPKGQVQKIDDAESIYLTGCDYFSMTSLKIDGSYKDTGIEEAFISLLVLEGEGTIKAGDQEIALTKGSSIFVPASFGEFELCGKMHVLKSVA